MTFVQYFPTKKTIQVTAGERVVGTLTSEKLGALEGELAAAVNDARNDPEHKFLVCDETFSKLFKPIHKKWWDVR
jgi:hypothetical protein